MRPPADRAGNYVADAQRLLILSRALEADKTIDEKWRGEMSLKISEIAQSLIMAPRKHHG